MSPSRVRRSNAAVYRLAAALKTAIRKAPVPLHKIGFPFDLVQSQISHALRDTAFGPVVKARFEALGASLGVPPEDCTRHTRRRS